MAEKTRILIVDDELPVGKSIASALADKEHAVDTAQSGAEALAKDQQAPYHLIVSDLMMPGMTGLELLQELRRRRPEALVIMITGFPSVRTAVEAMKLGAFDYVTKPFTPAELRAVVKRAKARRRIGAGAAPAAPTEATYTIPENTWARVEADGTVKVGMHPMFLNTIGHIGDIELPTAEATVIQGEACVTIIDSTDRSHRLWSPVSGRIVAVNESIKHDLGPLANDPFGKGWLVAIAPSNLKEELKNLLPLGPVE